MTSKTRAAIQSEIISLLADNTAGDITAADVRTVNADLADSAFTLLTDTTNEITTDPTGLTYATGATALAAIQELDAAVLATHNANTGIVFTTGSKVKTASSAGNTLLITAHDVDGAADTTFITLTANNTPTCDMSTAVTVNSKPLVGTTDISVTDNTIVRQDGTGGQAVQKSGVVIDDSDNISACGNIVPKNGSAIQTTTTAGNTLKMQAYDTDTGPAYVTFVTLTAGTAPSWALSVPAGGATASIDGTTIGATTAAAITGTNITATGYRMASVGNALTAAGTTRADALVLAKEVNNITTAAASTGVVLPAGVAGMKIRIYNNGANAIKVYANGSDTIDGTAGSTGVTLTNALRCEYECVATNTWLSAKMGATST